MPTAMAARAKPKKKSKKMRKLLGKKSKAAGVAKGKAIGFIEEKVEGPISGLASAAGAGAVAGTAGSMLAPEVVKLARFGLKKGLKAWKEKRQQKAMTNILARAIGNPRYAKKVRDEINSYFRDMFKKDVKLPLRFEKLYQGTETWNIFHIMHRSQQIDFMLDAAGRARIRKGLSGKETMRERRRLAKEIYREFLDRYVNRKQESKTRHLKKREALADRAERTDRRTMRMIDDLVREKEGAREKYARLEERTAILKVLAKPFLTRKERKEKIREIRQKFEKKRAAAA